MATAPAVGHLVAAAAFVAADGVAAGRVTVGSRVGGTVSGNGCRDGITPAVFVRIRVGVRIVVGTGQAECTGQAAGTGIAATCTQRTGVAAVSAITTVAIAAKREAADRKAAISAIAAIGVAAVARSEEHTSEPQ